MFESQINLDIGGCGMRVGFGFIWGGVLGWQCLLADLWPWSKLFARPKIVPIHCCYDDYITEAWRLSAMRDLHKQHNFLSEFSEVLGFHKCLVWILSVKAQTCTKGQCVHSNAKLVHSGVYCKRITLGISIFIFKLLLNFID